jgi:hypothetical protein
MSYRSYSSYPPIPLKQIIFLPPAKPRNRSATFRFQTTAEQKFDYFEDLAPDPTMAIAAVVGR